MALSITPSPCQVAQNDVAAVHALMQVITHRITNGVKPVTRGPGGPVMTEGLTPEEYCNALGTNLPLLMDAAAVITGTKKAVPV